MGSEQEEAGERYLQVKNVLESEKDDKGVRLLTSLEKQCLRYRDLVTNHESLWAQQKDGEQSTQEADRLEDASLHRRIAHDNVMADLKNLRTYLEEQKYVADGLVPETGVYTGDDISRQAIGKWARDLAGYLLAQAEDSTSDETSSD